MPRDILKATEQTSRRLSPKKRKQVGVLGENVANPLVTANGLVRTKSLLLAALRLWELKYRASKNGAQRG